MNDINEDSESTEGEREQRIEQITSWLIAKLREKGFVVRRKEVIEGERVRHVVDILAEANPLPDISLRVGFLIHSNDVKLENIEKYIAWLDELPLDKLVIVTTGEVDVEAYELAKKFNIDIVKFGTEQIAELKPKAIEKAYEEFYIEPLISINEAVEILKRESKSLLARKKKLEACSLTYIPLIMIKGEIAEKRIEEEKVTIRNISIVFDGIEGYKIITRGESLALEEDLGSFMDIPEESLMILRKLSEYGAMEISELSGTLDIPKDKLKILVNILVAKSLADIYGDLVEVRYTLFAHSLDLKEFVERLNAKIHTSIPIEEEKAVVLPIRINANKFIELIESLNGKVYSLTTFYYPFYIGILIRESGEVEEPLVLDGLRGDICPSFSMLLSNIEFLDTIRSRARLCPL
ncbi:MAG: hypothetical protein DRO15_02025 [Thermoprotei archaeon]|nr:MAG: hypothetical protein DRO15_02025 [Thermoprotei archaeon]